MTPKQNAFFWLSGAEAVAFSVFIIIMNTGYLMAPRFNAPGDYGGVASATTSDVVIAIAVWGIVHHLVQAWYNANREKPESLLTGELCWDVVTSWLPVTVCIVMLSLGADTDWFWKIKIAKFAIVVLACLDDILPTLASAKVLASRLR